MRPPPREEGRIITFECQELHVWWTAVDSLSDGRKMNSNVNATIGCTA